MKKLIAMILTLMLAVTFCAMACAGAEELYPTYSVDMEAYGTADSTVMAKIDPARIEADNLLVYSVYGNDLYKAEDILALKPGDQIFINNEHMTVETVEKTENGVELNGGFISEETEGEGATLVYDENDPAFMVSTLYDGDVNITMVGEAMYPMADTVHLKTFRMDETGEYNGEYNEADVAAADMQSYLTELSGREPEMVPFVAPNCTVRLENGKVVEIVVEWSPSV